MTFNCDETVQHAAPLPEGEVGSRLRDPGEGISFTRKSCSPLTRNGREAPIPTSPLRGEVVLPARSQANML
jgi:hypothetical protein